MSHRVFQLNAALQQMIAEIISQKIEVPFEFFVTVTKVECAPDLQTAKVFLSVLPFARGEEARKFMNRSRAEIQRWLAPKLKTKYTPIIHFAIDDTIETADKICKQLDEIRET